jgi:hypothetical protein
MRNGNHPGGGGNMSEILVVDEEIIAVVVDEKQVLTVEGREDSAMVVLGGPDQIVSVNFEGTEQIEVIESPGQIIKQIAVIESGPQGRPGMDNVDLPLVAAVAIGGQRVVATDEQGMAVYADNLTRYKTVIGISTGAANQGAVLTVKPFGRFEDSSWNWNPGKGLFLDQNGLIVQDAPSVGAIVPLGFVVTPKRIFISIGSRIERE